MSGTWHDLSPRTGSGIAIAVVGLAALWAGGTLFAAVVASSCGLMIWELSRMTAPDKPAQALQSAVLAGAVIGASRYVPAGIAIPLLAASAVVTAGLAGRQPVRLGIYALASLLAAYGFLLVRDDFGAVWMLWLVLVVVVTDLAGYFAGRAFGGPKFWPRISPKKTWSGTAAGWVAAAATGLAFVVLGGLPVSVLWLSPLLSFGSQIGDIAESALKRRHGVKDSSALIPGHGGVLDRFDGMMGAALVFMALMMAGAITVAGAG
ncbi:MAG: phosphatidate cytidylyltransferase [Halocynthiibacter sp.]